MLWTSTQSVNARKRGIYAVLPITSLASSVAEGHKPSHFHWLLVRVLCIIHEKRGPLCPSQELRAQRSEQEATTHASPSCKPKPHDTVHPDVLCPTSYRATPLHPLKRPRKGKSLTPHPRHPHSPQNSVNSEFPTYHHRVLRAGFQLEHPDSHRPRSA